MFYVNLLYTKINDEYTSQDPPVTEVTLKIVLDWQNSKNRVGTSRVSTGIPGYGLHTEIIWNFFPFPLWKRFRKTGIPERFFSVKRKFPERCSGIPNRYGIPKRSGNFRNVQEYRPEIFRKIVPEISGFRNNWYHNYIKVLHM